MLTSFRQFSGEREVKIHLRAWWRLKLFAKLIATNNGADAGVRQGLDG
jgi:hypothetical protein